MSTVLAKNNLDGLLNSKLPVINSARHQISVIVCEISGKLLWSFVVNHWRGVFHCLLSLPRQIVLSQICVWKLSRVLESFVFLLFGNACRKQGNWNFFLCCWKGGDLKSTLRRDLGLGEGTCRQALKTNLIAWVLPIDFYVSASLTYAEHNEGIFGTNIRSEFDFLFEKRALFSQTRFDFGFERRWERDDSWNANEWQTLPQIQS